MQSETKMWDEMYSSVRSQYSRITADQERERSFSLAVFSDSA